jgi:hypothetical protein
MTTRHKLLSLSETGFSLIVSQWFKPQRSAEVYFAIAYLARPGNLHPKDFSRLQKRPVKGVTAAERNARRGQDPSIWHERTKLGSFGENVQAELILSCIIIFIILREKPASLRSLLQAEQIRQVAPSGLRAALRLLVEQLGKGSNSRLARRP